MADEPQKPSKLYSVIGHSTGAKKVLVKDKPLNEARQAFKESLLLGDKFSAIEMLGPTADESFRQATTKPSAPVNSEIPAP
jgi:hypothetical protein